MILLSIDCQTQRVNRFDTAIPEGLTHTGFLKGDGGDAAEVLREFAQWPDPACRVRRLLRPGGEVAFITDDIYAPAAAREHSDTSLLAQDEPLLA